MSNTSFAYRTHHIINHIGTQRPTLDHNTRETNDQIMKVDMELITY